MSVDIRVVSALFPFLVLGSLSYRDAVILENERDSRRNYSERGGRRMDYSPSLAKREMYGKRHRG